MTKKTKVYLVGLPALGHPGGSRYLGFRPFLGIDTVHLKAPVSFRFFTSYWGWRFDNLITKFSRRPYYTFGLLAMECKAALHMLFHRRTLYHAIKGDVDLCLLPRMSRLTGNYLIASFHEPAEKLTFWQIDKWMTKHLKAVVLLGESQRKHFDGLISPERVYVVPHGLDTDYFQPPESRSTLPVCITVGSHMRDGPTMSCAMERVWDTNPEVRFVVVGARRPNDPNPPPDVTDERVTYLDHIDDQQLLKAYHESSLAVLSLKHAVANNALLEAMSCGLPVVASDVGDIHDYLGDKAGIVCSPGDPAALADGILRVLGDSDLADRMSSASRERALRYDNRVIAKEMRRVYLESIGLEELSGTQSKSRDFLPASASLTE